MRTVIRLALGLVVVLAACGEPAASPSPTTSVAPASATTTAPQPSTTTATTATTTTTSQPEGRWTAAKAGGPLPVFDFPGDTRPARVLPETTILGTPTVVFVLDRSGGDWVEVRLPGRPNGAIGWIHAEDVSIFPVHREVVVDLTGKTLTVVEEGRTLLETSIGIGSTASPTPTGRFFVTDAVRITQTDGPWGPYAFGLSARSDSVTEFNGGDGIIGIHGTNRPDSIGQARSLGCIRVPNDVMLDVAELISVGTPVTIRS